LSRNEDCPLLQVILFEENTRIKVRIPMPLPNLAKFKELLGDSIKIETLGTKPTGEDYTLTAENCSFVSGTDYCEVKVELTLQQLKDLECLPQNDEDGIEEKAWIDMADGASGSTSNINDSMVFEQSVSGTLRGSSSALKERGDLNSTPPNSPPDKTFAIAGGAEIITVEIKSAVSDRRQIANQADIFY
jgi:hypothetical protein